MKTLPVFLFLAGGVALAQEGLLSVDQILSKYVEGLGGKAAIEKVKSRSAKGSMELTDYGVTASIETFAKAPNHSISITTVEGYGVVREAFDGQVAWTDNPERGISEAKGVELDQRRRGSDMYRALHFKDGYQSMAVTGKQAVGGRDAFVVEATPAEGKPEKFLFDAESGLLVQVEAERPTENGPMKATTTLADYKEVDGVKVPMTMKLQSQALNFVLRFSEVKTNVDIDDAKFKKPGQ